jgi:hypothetical protein
MKNFTLRNILTAGYRIVLFDFSSFVINTLVLVVFVPLVTDPAAGPRADNPLVNGIVAGFCLCIVFLQPLGAILKLQAAHQRNPDLKARAKTFLSKAGCLPVFIYFALQLMFLIVAANLVAEMGNYQSAIPELYTILFFCFAGIGRGEHFSGVAVFRRPTRPGEGAFFEICPI